MNWAELNVLPADQPGQLYVANLPAHEEEYECPVLDCPGHYRNYAALRGHFCRHHWNDSIHIVEEGPTPFPHCERCHKQLPPQWHNNRHYQSLDCHRGIDRRRQREALQRAFEASQVSFSIDGTALASVNNMLYLGRQVTYNNSDWATLYQNLKKAQNVFVCLLILIRWQGQSGNFWDASRAQTFHARCHL